MGNIQFSDYQIAVINEVARSNKSLVVEGVAGCGKTFTMIHAIKEYLKFKPNHKVSFIAFNKEIVRELTEKCSFSHNIHCCTTHAMGYSAIIKALGDKRLNVRDRKWSDYINDHLNELSKVVSTDMQDQRMLAEYKGNVANWLNKCRINLLTADDTQEIACVGQTYGIEPIADEYDAVRKLLNICYNLHKGDIIDYIDMLTFGALNPQYVYKTPLVVIDECQDLNKAQHRLMLNSVARGGKFVAVGDPHQAINGFAGSMADSFEQLVSLACGNTLPLSVNYRCGSKIIEAVNPIMPTIKAHEGAIEGEVRSVANLKEISGNDFVLCRKTAPLISLAIKYIAHGKCAVVRGRDIGQGLKALINKCVGKSHCTINALLVKLDKEKQLLEDKLLAKGIAKADIEEQPSMIGLCDKIECIEAIAEQSKSVNELLTKIDNLFTDEQKANAIQLMTCHKSKGLENDRVFILLPNKLPLTWRTQQDWEYQQELNLKYVAYTRAKKELIFVNMDEASLRKAEL